MKIGLSAEDLKELLAYRFEIKDLRIIAGDIILNATIKDPPKEKHPEIIPGFLQTTESLTGAPIMTELPDNYNNHGLDIQIHDYAYINGDRATFTFPNDHNSGSMQFIDFT